MTDTEFLDKIKQADVMVNLIYDQVYERPELKYLTPLDFHEMLKRNIDSFSYDDKPIHNRENWMIRSDAHNNQLLMEDLYLHYLLSEHMNNLATEHSHEMPRPN